MSEKYTFSPPIQARIDDPRDELTEVQAQQATHKLFEQFSLRKDGNVDWKQHEEHLGKSTIKGIVRTLQKQGADIHALDASGHSIYCNALSVTNANYADLLIREFDVDPRAGKRDAMYYLLHHKNHFPSDRRTAFLFVLLTQGMGRCLTDPANDTDLILSTNDGTTQIYEHNNASAFDFSSLDRKRRTIKGTITSHINNYEQHGRALPTAEHMMKIYAYGLEQDQELAKLLRIDPNETREFLNTLPPYVQHAFSHIIASELTAHAAKTTIKGPAKDWRAMETSAPESEVRR